MELIPRALRFNVDGWMNDTEISVDKKRDDTHNIEVGERERDRERGSEDRSRAMHAQRDTQDKTSESSIC